MIFGLTITEFITVAGVITGNVVIIVNAIKAKADRQDLRDRTIVLDQKADANKVESEAAKIKASEASEKLDVIHTLTDGNLSVLKTELDSTKSVLAEQNLRIAELMNHIMKQPETVKLQEKLDENTVATEQNTAITKKLK